MGRNVRKPTYFGSGRVLNSKYVSEPYEQFCFCYKLDPKHDQNFIKNHFRHCKLRPVHVHARIGGTFTNNSVHTAFLTNKKQNFFLHKTITQFLCLIFKDIKDWLTHKKNHLKNSNIQIREFPACLENFRIRLYTVCVYTM